ncbi:sperm-associated antigen 8-like [Diadema antillarum]|uniref:sperm-associated antigen 8-like n=1 Tax=Diadema antillarum TaxID=105358 RepID=UPI003A884C6F
MATLNSARTLNNSGGRCLMENWVEERQVYDTGLDSAGLANSEGYTSNSSLPYKDGHKGILTGELEAPAEKLSTCMDSYQEPQKSKVRTVGKKKELMERALLAQVTQDIQAEVSEPQPIAEYKSVTQKDFNIDDFQSVLPPPKYEHNVNTEQPITFWSEHKEKIHGVSQVKTLDTPFKKNSSFSKPIEESFDQPKPYEAEQHPWL